MRIHSKIPGKTCFLRDQRIAFLGAGSAGAGVADLICQGMVEEAKAAGVTEKKFLDVSYYRKNNIWLIDSKGTITDTRADFKVVFHE